MAQFSGAEPSWERMTDTAAHRLYEAREKVLTDRFGEGVAERVARAKDMRYALENGAGDGTRVAVNLDLQHGLDLHTARAAYETVHSEINTSAWGLSDKAWDGLQDLTRLAAKYPDDLYIRHVATDINHEIGYNLNEFHSYNDDPERWPTIDDADQAEYAGMGQRSATDFWRIEQTELDYHLARATGEIDITQVAEQRIDQEKAWPIQERALRVAEERPERAKLAADRARSALSARIEQGVAAKKSEPPGENTKRSLAPVQAETPDNARSRRPL